MRPYFITVLVLWTVVAAFHLHRWGRRRHPMSLVIALYPAGWAVWCAREAHVLPLQYTHVATAAAGVLGVAAAGFCVATWVLEWTRG